MKRIILIILCFFSIESVSAQARSGDASELSNLRSRTVVVDKDTIKIDSLSIIPNSVLLKVGERLLSSEDYEFNYPKSELYLKTEDLPDSLIISYRVYPYNFSKVYFNKDTAIIGKRGQIVVDPFQYIPGQTVDEMLDLGKLDYDGSFSRGISFGNKQDVVVNSDFNLRMSGMLSDDVEITAAITDNNIPIQPEGNTQQIQDFDKLFIQLKRKQSTLIVGDFDVPIPKSYFMRYKRKATGAFVATSEKTDHTRMEMDASAAIARGNYNRMSFIGKEGNQGPYKLTGADGETFIIVIAGSERVYIDGKQLERGEEFDYVIDYNLAELSFTTKQLITKDKRVVVEFEYSNQNYSRSLVTAKALIGNEHRAWDVQIFSQQDHKNSPIQEIDEDFQTRMNRKLAGAGDNDDLMQLPGIDTVDYDVNRILYALDDSTILGQDIYVYSTDPNLAIYSLRFTKLGPGKGDYDIAETSANGRVYEYVPRISGMKMGAYEPIVRLVSPQRIQMVVSSLSQRVGKKGNVKGELALSNYDRNTFSKLNSGDNTGMGANMKYKQAWKIGGDEKNPLELQLTGDYEFRNHNFTHIEQYRAVEFTRDWNSGGLATSTDEHLGTAGIELRKDQRGFLKYSYGVYERSLGDFKGGKHEVGAGIERSSLDFELKASYLETVGKLETSQYLRPNAALSKSWEKLWGIVTGATFESERNRISDAVADTLSKTSFRYDTWEVYVENSDTAKRKVRLSYLERYDYLSNANDFSKISIGRTISTSGDLIQTSQQKLKITATYRQLEITDTSLIGLKNEEAILSRLDYNFVIKNGLVSSTSFYEIGTGQEQKREFEYLKVQSGTGTHIYAGDYNDNDVRELSEYEIAIFADTANYVKIFKPTDEFRKVQFLRYNQDLAINPKVIWHGKQGIRKLLGRFGTRSSLQIDRKVFDGADASAINPFDLNVQDTSLLHINSINRHTLYFNRTGKIFGMDFSWLDSRNKVVLTNGFETRTRAEYEIHSRVNISRSTGLEMDATTGKKARDIFTLRQFELSYYELKPKINFLSSNKFRVSLLYEYTERSNNPLYGGEVASTHEGGVESRFNSKGKGAISGKFTLAIVKYDGDPSAPVAYTILQGLEDGNNYLWELAIDRRLSKTMQLRIGYDGRKVGDNPVVHTGSAQLRANF